MTICGRTCIFGGPGFQAAVRSDVASKKAQLAHGLSFDQFEVIHVTLHWSCAVSKSQSRTNGSLILLDTASKGGFTKKCIASIQTESQH